ncbi:response regulator [Altericista sp. CCNU0014]|uniref:response regulator n=1 Tax=Altericista sp. CCNU0014 TaxID=3082949 RepID=UPI00384B4179
MNQSTHTILIVDDCPEDCELYRRYLLQDKTHTYTFLETESGQAGLALCQQHQPDLILLDYRLPDMDGLEWLTQLSIQTASPHLPVIMVTGQGNEALAVQAIKAGAQDYLVKGQITPERLQLTVHETLERVHLRTQLQQRLKREQLVAQIAGEIHRSLDLNYILQTTTTLVRQFLQTDRVLIFRLQSEGWGTITTESVGAEWTPLLSASLYDPCFTGQSLQSFRQGVITAKSDIHDGSIDPCHAELLARLEVRANLVVPILQNQQVWGLLIAHHCTAPRHWQPFDIELVREVATQVGIAVQQAELYQQAQDELSQRRQTEVFLQEMGKDLEQQVAARTAELSQLTQDLRQSLEKLQISEAQYRSLFESIDEGFCIIEVLFDRKQKPVDFRFLQVNPAFERLSTIPDAVGKRMRDIAPQHEDYWFENFGKVALTGESMRFENYAAELQRWYDVFAFSVADPELHHVGVLFTETTARKQGEIQLREISDALSNAVEGISRLDPQGRYLFVNEAYAKAVGYTPAEMIGMDWQRTIHPDDLEAVIAEYQHMLNAGKVELEARGIRKDGSIFDKQLVMIGAYDDQHQFIGHHCFMKDITEKKQLEAQFLRAQRLESIGTLASGIAHDLNNILTPVLAAALLLPRRLAPVDPTSQQLLEILEGSAKRGRDLVQQVLSFARGQDEQRHILQVGYLLSEMGKIARQTFPKSIQVQTQVSTRDLWLMHADTTQLHQVLMNLCVNARDAMPDGGTLTIAAENCEIDETFAHRHLDAQIGAYVKITIADTGTGIAPAAFDRIFDPFFTTKAQGQGTGLGLPTVRTIVKNHGGFIAIETAPGQGTSFQVYLPALPPDEDTTRHPSPETALPELLNGNGELVLVVDDESAIRQTIQVVLETHGFRALVAQDGIDAIALYAQYRSEIDLVLLDVMMPAMDGFKLIETLAKFTPPVPIIAMSGVASHQNSVLSHTQVQAFVAKPFTADALLTAIRTVHTSNSVKTPVDRTRT